MRSVLLTAASKTAIRRRRGSSSTTIATRSTSGSASIQSWTMPSPNGPSRSTVGGTIPQPRRLGDEERRHLAPGQRPVREVVERPLADDRLVDAGGLEVATGAGHGRARGEHRVVGRDPQPPDDLDLAARAGARAPSSTASTGIGRPSSSIETAASSSPSSSRRIVLGRPRSRSSTSAPSSADRGVVLGRLVHAARSVEEVAVAARADVALRVQRLAAQRARRPAAATTRAPGRRTPARRAA